MCVCVKNRVRVRVYYVRVLEEPATSDEGYAVERRWVGGEDEVKDERDEREVGWE